MVLHSKTKRIIREMCLLDHTIFRTPCFNDQTGSQSRQSLMMRAVHLRKLNWHTLNIAQFLNIGVFSVVMMGNIKMQRTAQGDIEHLETAANGQQRKTLLQSFRQGFKFPRVTRWIGIFNQSWIGHGLF